MTSEKNNELVPSFLETIRKSDSADIVKDALEMGIDAALKEGLLKDIPIIGWSIGIYNTSVTIKDYIFARKIALFLTNLDRVNDLERDKFIRILDDDSDKREKVVSTIIMILDRIDDFEKADYIAKLFAAYMKEELDIDTFKRLSISVERCHYQDLVRLLQYFSQQSNRDIDRQFNKICRNIFIVGGGFSRFDVITAGLTFGEGQDASVTYYFNLEADLFSQIILKQDYVPSERRLTILRTCLKRGRRRQLG